MASGDSLWFQIIAVVRKITVQKGELAPPVHCEGCRVGLSFRSRSRGLRPVCIVAMRAVVDVAEVPGRTTAEEKRGRDSRGFERSRVSKKYVARCCSCGPDTDICSYIISVYVIKSIGRCVVKLLYTLREGHFARYPLTCNTFVTKSSRGMRQEEETTPHTKEGQNEKQTGALW